MDKQEVTINDFMKNTSHTLYTHVKVHLQESLFSLEPVNEQNKTMQYCQTITTNLTIPKVAIGQSEAGSAVLISCDIKSLT